MKIEHEEISAEELYFLKPKKIKKIINAVVNIVLCIATFTIALLVTRYFLP